MERVHEAGDVEGGEHGKDFAVCSGCDLLDLETLRDYVLVGYHYLLHSSVHTRNCVP